MPETALSSAVALRGDAEHLTELLNRPGALLRGHFSLLAGMHTDAFFRFSAIARDPEALDDIASLIRGGVDDLAIDAILSPTTAGVGLAWTLASSMGVPLHLASLDESGRPAGMLGEPAIDGMGVLLVNDVVTTGRGLEAMARLARDRGASIAAGAWFLSRSDVDVERLLGAPCVPVVRWHLPAWAAAECDACEHGDEPQRAYDLN